LGNRQGDNAGSWAIVVWLLLAAILCVCFAFALTASAVLRGRFFIAAAVAFAFALLGSWVRGVSRSGAAAGGLIALVVLCAGGFPMFAMLVLVFILTWSATQVGRERKETLGIAERPKGRNGAQVLANIYAAAMAITLSLLLPWPHALQVAALAALAEAAADTVSSEIGEAFGERVRLITTWREVPVGTDGGVSLVGMIAGLLAAFVIGLAGSLIVGFSYMYIIALCGFIGMICDSLLGALLERRGWLTNNAVNFLSTCIAAGVAFVIVLAIGHLLHPG
jgi:uncharacterized protein (TIGR00297 family)